jgi:2,5-diketo-D-gluconate reductase A
MSYKNRSVTLNDGHSMPILGLGVFALDHESTARAVASALEQGYRCIDTAAVYGNEAGVGEGIRRAGIPRDELFVTTKLWNDDHASDRSGDALARSLDALGLERVDLYLIHWPHSDQGRYLEAWTALEGMREAGSARSIGVSNFSPAQIAEVTALGGTVPAVNQIESHPFWARTEEVDAHLALGIISQAWSPLARGAVFADPWLGTVAAEVGASVAQVALAWNLRRGVSVIPKASSPARIAENLAALDVVLSPDQAAAVGALDRGQQVESGYYVNS